MKLYCLPGQGIRVIDAFYGRNTEEICDEQPNQPAKLNCHSPPNTKAEVEKRCNYRENCAVEASNNLFTDPCLNTYKYLRVTHICVEEPLRIVSACDGDGVRILCPQGTVIKVNSVTYGKTRHDVCNKPGIRTNTMTCQAVPHKVTQIVVERCDGKPFCAVHTITDIFSAVGDPCVGILKHLDVNYMCQ